MRRPVPWAARLVGVVGGNNKQSQRARGEPARRNVNAPSGCRRRDLHASARAHRGCRGRELHASARAVGGALGECRRGVNKHRQRAHGEPARRRVSVCLTCGLQPFQNEHI